MAQYAFTFTSGDTVTPTKLNDARTVSEIVDADIKSDAAIAGTKIAPDFGAQDITVSTATRSITNTDNFALAFGTNNTERARIDSIGRALIGHNTNVGSQALQIHSNSPADVVGVYRWVNDSAGPRLTLHKSRSATVGNYSIVQNGDSLGTISFRGDNGTDASSEGAAIIAQSSGSPSASNMPCALLLSTTQSGSSATERMRITAAGIVAIGTANPNAAALLDVTSTNRGFLPPRMTTAQRNAISTPPAGLMIYNTSTNKLNVRTASSWEAVTSA
jgi:hypothetical protein